MQPLTAAAMLDVWDRSSAWSPTRRALAILQAASPDAAPEELAGMSVGMRDSCLLSLHEWFFGSQVASQTRCLACQEKVECVFGIDDVRVVAPPIPEKLEVCIGERRIQFRLPDSADLDAIERETDPTGAMRLLVGRCAPAAVDLCTAEIEALAAEMTRHDPQACVEIALTCPACAHRWSSTFDVVSFFWTEIHAWAQRMLREVHSLASAYGWRERDILAMSARRREAYLDLLSA
jgi:hypothetical protein